MDDGVGPRGVEQAGEGRLVGQLDEHGPGAGRRDREAVRRQDLEAAPVKELGEAAAEQAARPGDEDAHGSSRPSRRRR